MYKICKYRHLNYQITPCSNCTWKRSSSKYAIVNPGALFVDAFYVLYLALAPSSIYHYLGIGRLSSTIHFFLAPFFLSRLVTRHQVPPEQPPIETAPLPVATMPIVAHKPFLNQQCPQKPITHPDKGGFCPLLKYERVKMYIQKGIPCNFRNFDFDYM